jgi:YHS domain-containing protein
MKSFFLLLFIVPALITAAQTSKRLSAFNLQQKMLAIQGYDPVAYFTNNKAIEGSKTHTLTHDGITYHFSTAQNKETFKANPARYEPQYGGWCAYAMGATGEKVAIDPETFKIINGKLFLFYNRYLTNTLKLWNKDEQNLHAKAEANWPRLYN